MTKENSRLIEKVFGLTKETRMQAPDVIAYFGSVCSYKLVREDMGFRREMEWAKSFGTRPVAFSPTDEIITSVEGLAKEFTSRGIYFQKRDSITRSAPNNIEYEIFMRTVTDEEMIQFFKLLQPPARKGEK